MKTPFRLLLKSLLFLLLLAGPASLRAQGTAFTCQGLLEFSNVVVTGSYDMEFQLFNSATPSTNSAVSSILLISNVPVSNGLFTVTLDFSNASYLGANFWVQISAATDGSTNFSTLSPLLPISPTPYAISAGTASNALTAAALTGGLSSANLAGTYSNAVVLSNSGNVFYGNGAGLTNLTLLTGNAVVFTNTGSVFVGTFTGTYFGNGAGLTNLAITGSNVVTNANNTLTIISDSAAVHTDYTNIWTGTNTFENTVIATNAQSSSEFAGAFIGNGGGLTNLPASSLIGNIQGGNLSGLYNNVVSFTNTNNTFSGSFTGDGSGLTGVEITSNLVITTNYTTNVEFTGDGEGLTNLAATNIVGTITNALASPYTNAITISNDANVFVGDGAGLTDLQASNIVGAVEGGNLSGVYGNVVSFTNSANVIAGNGSNLANLDAANITFGTVPVTNLPVATSSSLGVVEPDNTTIVVTNGVITSIGGGGGGAALLTNNNTWTGTNIFTNTVIATNAEASNQFAGKFIGDGSSLTGVIAAGVSSNFSLSASNAYNLTNTANVFDGAFVGDGGGLTNLPVATSASLGVVEPDNTTIVVTNGVISAIGGGGGGGGGSSLLTNNNTWTASNTFLGVFIATNSGTTNEIAGTFSGDGGGLTNLQTANLVGSIQAGNLSGVYGNVVQFTNSADEFAGNGSNLTDLNPTNISAGTAGINISGNANTANTAGAAGAAGLASNVVVGISITNAFLTNAYITNSVLAGDGSGLTNLQYSGLTGTVPNGGIGGTYTQPVSFNNSADTFAGNAATATLASNVVSGLKITNATVTGATITNSTFAGNGGNITNVNPTNISLGTAAINITGNAATASLASNLVSGVTISGATITNSTLYGSAANLTGLNASALATGTIPLAVENPAVITNGNAQSVDLASGLFVSSETVTNTLTVINGNLNVQNGVISGIGSNLTDVPALALLGSIPYTNLYYSGNAAGTILSNNGTSTVWAPLPSLATNAWGQPVSPSFPGTIINLAPYSSNTANVTLSVLVTTNTIVTFENPPVSNGWMFAVDFQQGATNGAVTFNTNLTVGFVAVVPQVAGQFISLPTNSTNCHLIDTFLIDQGGSNALLISQVPVTR